MSYFGEFLNPQSVKQSFILIIWYTTITTVLAFWKLVELVLWVFTHIQINVKGL